MKRKDRIGEKNIHSAFICQSVGILNIKVNNKKANSPIFF